MVNVLKDIVDKLDGTSYDNQGFAVIAASGTLKGGYAVKLYVKPYIKHEGTKGLPEEEHLMEMTNRLLAQYSGGSHYAVYKAEKVVDSWELLVQEIQEKTEDKVNEV